ncbi:MAG: hypothetical protein HY015_04180 [Bacteroidetes bacterium]|nr:hypothetical protein [Bacteroidota bacterium]MBI3482161.1 hypothetical protein [Bacteroidota bacterium]
MGASVYISQNSKVPSSKKKSKEVSLSIISADYISEFIIDLHFSDGKREKVDFLPLFMKYVKGDNRKYFSSTQFKKFRVVDGNISWGRNEDVIFTLDSILSFPSRSKEEVLYII